MATAVAISFLGDKTYLACGEVTLAFPLGFWIIYFTEGIDY